jgi:hypothetical protein
MCTVVHGDCGCGHSGFGLAEFVAVLAGLAAVGAGYVVLETFWPLALVLWLATAALAAKRVRRGLRRGLGWLLREMWRSWTTRRDRPTVPGRDVERRSVADRDVTLDYGPVRVWYVTLSAESPTGTLALGGAIVTGEWPSAAALEAETKARVLRQYGKRRELPPGPLHCRAVPACTLDDDAYAAGHMGPA